MLEESFTQELVVKCPNCSDPGHVLLERSKTLAGETVELFTCNLLPDQPSCRRECLPKDLR